MEKEITLEEINMRHISLNLVNNSVGEHDQEWDTKRVILHCSKSWNMKSVSQHLTNFSYDAKESILKWLHDEKEIAVNNYLEIWID